MILRLKEWFSFDVSFAFLVILTIAVGILSIVAWVLGIY